MQTRTHSLIESVTNTTVGFGLSLGSQLLIFPLFKIHVPFRTNLWLSLWFTALSIARGYVLRRVFARKTERQPQQGQP